MINAEIRRQKLEILLERVQRNRQRLHAAAGMAAVDAVSISETTIPLPRHVTESETGLPAISSLRAFFGGIARKLKRFFGAT